MIDVRKKKKKTRFNVQLGIASLDSAFLLRSSSRVRDECAQPRGYVSCYFPLVKHNDARRNSGLDNNPAACTRACILAARRGKKPSRARARARSEERFMFARREEKKKRAGCSLARAESRKTKMRGETPSESRTNLVRIRLRRDALGSRVYKGRKQQVDTRKRKGESRAVINKPVCKFREDRACAFSPGKVQDARRVHGIISYKLEERRAKSGL